MARAALFSLLAAVLLVGCSKGNFASASHENVFRYPIPAKPTTMDPGKVQDGDTIDLLQQVYEGLVGWGEDNKVAPRLAQTWDVSKDGRTYTFHLRTDAKFSSGRSVTAADFKWCIERNCLKTLNSETASTYLSDIVGVNEAVAGKSSDIPGIKVVNDHTLAIQIDKPRPYFLGKLTYPVAFVFDKNALSDPGKEINQKSEMIGTGGFKFDTVNPDQIVTLVPNPLYYEGAPKLARIERPYMPDASTRLAAFKSGDLDLLQLERQDVSGLQSDSKYQAQLHFYPRPSMWYIGMECDLIPALKDRRVRRAIAMAIDKDNICKNELGGMNPKADSIIPPGVFGYREHVNSLPYDPQAAKKMLADAGYPNGQGFPTLEIAYRNNRPDIRIVAEAVAQDLEKNLGIKTSERPLEWATYLEYNDKNQLGFFHMRWGADYLDAENFLSTLLASYGPQNHVSYHNAQFDALCAKADESSDPAERLKLYAQAEDIALQDAPFVPIYFQRDAEIISPRVHGIRESLFGHLPHTKVYMQ